MNKRGFTLLEVMVAVAILALLLTAIFSSEAVAIRMGHRARRLSQATLLARCKMAEIEETVAREGMPAIESHDTDGCCDGAEVEGIECEWTVSRVVLPDESGLEEDPAAAASTGLPAPAAGGGAPEAPFGGASVTEIMEGGMGAGDITSMAISYAFPILKPAIEEQVRRATVTVRWREGEAEHSFDVVQFLVNPPPVP